MTHQNGNFSVEVQGDGDDELQVEVSPQLPTGQDSKDLKIPGELPVLPVRDAVAFPGTVMQLQIHRLKSKRVLDLALTDKSLIAVVTQRDPSIDDPQLPDLYEMGTACEILKKYKLPDGGETIVVHGLARVELKSLKSGEKFLIADVVPHLDPTEPNTEQRALMHSLRSATEKMVTLSSNIPEEIKLVLQGIQQPGFLADFVAANLPLGVAHKQELLSLLDVTDRLRQVNLAAATHLEVLELSHKIQEQVNQQVDRSQREYYLREQMKVIQQELGETKTEAATIADLRARIAAAQMPKGVETEALREVDRLAMIPSVSPEYSMTLDYLEWLIELPWTTTSEDHLDLKRAEEILNEDHFGLEKVKRRILEFLAVRTLKKDTRGPILCFVGPPGVGKTSLGQSIARAMGRSFIRMSLGGVRDEASIRGHRRTYIGSMPGQIIREIRRAGTNNPVFMLDEVDKISGDVRGDPMSALLEVLDPAQNSTFTDHYLGLPFDLSKTFFIATANYVSAIAPALRDRMEMIEIPGYTQHEKLMIARQHLLPRQLRENGLDKTQLRMTDDLILRVITEYTREAGVRSLERKLGAVCRARAASVVRGDKLSPDITLEEVRGILGPAEFDWEKVLQYHPPGVVTGLAYTPVGGEILFIEATKMPGRGQLVLTGQLGDVMRESAQAASSIIRSRTGRWTVKPEDFSKFDLHVHVPSGAIPKDGPSAGIAMLVAMTSILLNRPVDPSIGMTGEITLSGRVLPIGGVREKILAAHHAGLRTVILPARNEPNVEEIPTEVRKEIKLLFVERIDEVLDFIFDLSKKKTKAGVKRPRFQVRATNQSKRASSAKSKTPLANRPSSQSKPRKTTQIRRTG